MNTDAVDRAGGNTAIRVMVADDEPPARSRLRRLLEEIGGVEVVAEAADGELAVAACREWQPQVALLDIRMPGTDGLEAARTLAGLPRPPAVIFVTAYDRHALEAFEAAAIDYLLKPVRRERLAQALTRATRLNPAQLAAIEGHGESPEAAAGRTHLRVRLGDRVELVPVAEVLYFRAEQKYVVVRHRNGEALLEESLKALETELGAGFLRVHRNALVARGAIAGMERGPGGRWYLRLRGCDDRVEVSRRHLPEVRRTLRELAGA